MELVQIQSAASSCLDERFKDDIHSHLVAASPNGLALEYFTPDREIVNFDRLVATPLAPVGGSLTLSEAAGHGLVLDPGAVAAHLRHDSSAGRPIPGGQS